MEVRAITEKTVQYIRSLHEKGALYILVGNFATKFVTFFGSIFLSRILSKNDMGILSYMENICSYAYVFIGLGMANALLRYVVLAETKEKKLAYVNYSLKRGLTFDIIIVVVLILINFFYPHKSSYKEWAFLIPILIIALPFQDLINQAQINERALFNNKRFAIVSVLSAAAVVLARVVGAKANDLVGVVICIVVVNAFLGVVLTEFVRKQRYRGITPAILTSEEKRVASSYAFQYMITNSLWSIFMLMDMFLLGNLLDDPSVVADYKIAFAFPVNMSIFSSAVGIFIVPYFVKNEDNASWVKKNYGRTMMATGVLIGTVALVLIVFAKVLIGLYGPQYANVVPLMRWLVLSCVIENVFRYPIANILAAIGKVKYNMIVSGIGLIAQTLLNIIFIPKYGAYALPFTNTVVHFAMAIALFTYFSRLYNIMGGRNG